MLFFLELVPPRNEHLSCRQGIEENDIEDVYFAGIASQLFLGARPSLRQEFGWKDWRFSHYGGVGHTGRIEGGGAYMPSVDCSCGGALSKAGKILQWMVLRCSDQEDTMGGGQLASSRHGRSKYMVSANAFSDSRQHQHPHHLSSPYHCQSGMQPLGMVCARVCK